MLIHRKKVFVDREFRQEQRMPHMDGGGLTISGNLKSFEGPVLKCRVSTERRALYLNELVIHEIRNNACAISQNFLFICCKIEFVQCGKNP